ncbi:MAG: CocE/NonD family hydrolase [Elainellaceae cyanobacterium]
MLPVRHRQTASMQTRDGVRLDADMYAPDAEGQFPVLLMRQPYGRAIASTVVYAHPTWYAAQGYIVVIQDVRGRGSSEGTFKLFASEIEDGEDTVNWAASLPGSDGTVGMYGFSYQGMTQLYAAIARPPALKTICPAMIGYDLYTDWAYEGGAFCLQGNLSWAMQLAAETARRQGKGDAYRTLYTSARNPSLSDPCCARSGILKQLAPDSFYHAWLTHAAPVPYWDTLSPKGRMDDVDLPMLHIGGWFDAYMRGTLNFYKEMARRSAHPQHLWVGPWAHLPWGRKVGAVDFGSEATSPIDQCQIRWFDQFLKGRGTEMLDEAPVRLFELGGNRWRSLSAYPHQSTPYFLHSSGLAALSDGGGQLVESVQPSPSLPDTFVHDPWRPVPALGGHSAFPAGSFDRSGLDCRTDVITFTSAPLSDDLHLAGTVELELYCAADSQSFDLCVVLSDAHPQGAAYVLCQGYRRIEGALADPPHTTPLASPPQTPLTISLQPICAKIPKGHAYRLSISAACFPAYPVNPGTSDSPQTARLIDAKVITLSVYCGDRFPSKLLLPVTPP